MSKFLDNDIELLQMLTLNQVCQRFDSPHNVEKVSSGILRSPWVNRESSGPTVKTDNDMIRIVLTNRYKYVTRSGSDKSYLLQVNLSWKYLTLWDFTPKLNFLQDLMLVIIKWTSGPGRNAGMPVRFVFCLSAWYWFAFGPALGPYYQQNTATDVVPLNTIRQRWDALGQACSRQLSSQSVVDIS